MTSTPQSQVIGAANQLINIGQQLYNLQIAIDAVNKQYSQLTLGTTLGALATTATATDGSLGAADGSPNAAHSIDTRIYTTLSRAISANDLGSLNTLITAVSTLLSGSAVSQQGQAPQLLNKIIGG